MTGGGTIVAIASPPGRADRALVRVSGPHAQNALESILEHAPSDRGAHRVRFTSAGARLPALLVRFAPGASYTGEDAAELLLPGSPALAERVTDALTAVPGVRRAEPGEFTARAFLGDRLSIEQAEGVAMLVAARSGDQRRAARRLLSGAAGATYREWTDRLAQALALVEAGIDFTDQEDVVAIAPRDLEARLRDLADAVRRRLASAPAERADHTPLVLLAGAPNAGKSTLFNALLGRRRTVVSETPGATRDAVTEPLDLAPDLPGAEAPTVALTDMAGLDDALAEASAADRASQHAARELLERADVVVLCDADARFALERDLPETAALLRVRTKADLPGRAPAGLAVCALDGWNLAALRRAIADAASAAVPGAAAESDVLPRHRRALRRAIGGLDDALALLATSDDDRALPQPELLAGSMRAALDALGEITGRVHPDDVIGRVFASFCVGK